MKKDWFRGKISNEYIGWVKFTLILGTLVLALLSIFFLYLALFYVNTELSAKIVLYCIAGLCAVLAVIFPVCTLFLIRQYPKGRKITKHIIREYVFREYEYFSKNRRYED